MVLNNIIFKNISSGKQVTIATKRIEYTMNNAIGQPITIPSTSETSTETTKIVNLLKITERYIVDGWIMTGLNVTAGPPTERSNAKDVRDDLVSITKTRAVKGSSNTQTTMTYDGVDYNVTFEKISIGETSQDIGQEAPDGVLRYDVKLSLIVGDAIV